LGNKDPWEKNSFPPKERGLNKGRRIGTEFKNSLKNGRRLKELN